MKFTNPNHPIQACPKAQVFGPLESLIFYPFQKHTQAGLLYDRVRVPILLCCKRQFGERPKKIKKLNKLFFNQTDRRV